MSRVIRKHSNTPIENYIKTVDGNSSVHAFTLFYHIQPCQQSQKAGSITVFVLHVRKLRLQVMTVKQLVGGRTEI